MNKADDQLAQAYARTTEAALVRALSGSDPTSKKIQIQKLFREFAKNQGRSSLILPMLLQSGQAVVR